jgi:hypothetical protein
MDIECSNSVEGIKETREDLQIQVYNLVIIIMLVIQWKSFVCSSFKCLLLEHEDAGKIERVLLLSLKQDEGSLLHLGGNCE